MNNTQNTEAEKLFQELRKCFLVIEKLKDPVQIAVMQKDYSVSAYNQVMGQLYRLIEDYSETHTCSVSTITVSYPLSQKHPLYSEIKSGTIIWQRPDSN